jgi:NAD(P)-dependent dehydrogenase (short-subunit alcohol dehydrogenase family)
MKHFENKVAVVTGGASGIGLALAKKALANGMKVVIADVDPLALERASLELDAGERVLAVQTDVSSAEAVDNLARETHRIFGPAQLLFNNAGVGGGGLLWEQSDAEWDWVLGVNLKGVINGVRAFTPQMLKAGEGHIVNTASIAGLMSTPTTSTYSVSKHAVVALSEVLYGDLKSVKAEVGVSVLCPSFVNTKIYDYERSRPDAAHVDFSEDELTHKKAVADASAEFFATTLSPDLVAAQVFDAIAADQFYILTHPVGSKVQIGKRMRGILENGAPSVTGPEEFPTV